MARNPDKQLLCGATSLLLVLLFAIKNIKHGRVKADSDDTTAFSKRAKTHD